MNNPTVDSYRCAFVIIISSQTIPDYYLFYQDNQFFIYSASQLPKELYHCDCLFLKTVSLPLKENAYYIEIHNSGTVNSKYGALIWNSSIDTSFNKPLVAKKKDY